MRNPPTSVCARAWTKKLKAMRIYLLTVSSPPKGKSNDEILWNFSYPSTCTRKWKAIRISYWQASNWMYELQYNNVVYSLACSTVCVILSPGFEGCRPKRLHASQGIPWNRGKTNSSLVCSPNTHTILIAFSFFVRCNWPKITHPPCPYINPQITLRTNTIHSPC